MSNPRSSTEKAPLEGFRTQQVRHLSRRRSQSSSLTSDRQIYLAQKEEALSSGGLYDDIEYDSEDERFLMELKAKPTPLQEMMSKARRFFGAASACILILFVCLWLIFGLPNYMAQKSIDSWQAYEDPRIKSGNMPVGKPINANWKKPPHGQ